MSMDQSIHVDDEGNAELAMTLSAEKQRQAAAERIPLPKPFRLTKAP